MSKDLLFAIDKNTDEVIVSISPKGTNKIEMIERLHRKDNSILYDAVLILTNISRSPDFDTAVFKAMDKVCQLLYAKQKSS
ncbi:MAG: hypothetical protein ACKOQ6_05070 [Bacteroidota bacterium]